MKASTKRVLFYIVFFALILAPVVAMLVEWQNRNILINVSVLLGALGLALAGTQLGAPK